MRAGLTFEYPLRIEFEDLDAGRVVHHPKYLNFYERARCAALEEMGIPFSEMLKHELAFAVAECEMKYRAPLVYRKPYWIYSRVLEARPAGLQLHQVILSDRLVNPDAISLSEPLSIEGLRHWMRVQLICVNLISFRTSRMPESILEKMRTLDDSNVRPSDS